MENQEQHSEQNTHVGHQERIIVQKPLPNSTAVLVLGILSIVFCWCYGIFGIILGIIAIVLGNKDIALYNSNPDEYSESSLKNTKAGKICGIIGVSLSGLYVLYLIIIFVFYGSMITSIINAGNFPY